MTRLRKAMLGIGALCLAAAPIASAHVSYLLPTTFAPEEAGPITIQAAFAEDFGLPEVALISENFAVYAPDGTQAEFAKSETFARMTVLDADIDMQGTYRISSGERIGRLGTQVFVGEQWVPLEPGSEVPADVQTRPSQTATVTDVYVTNGTATRPVLDLKIGRLAIRPITHPNEANTASGFAFQILLDGSPIHDQQVFIDRFAGAHEAPAYSLLLTTDDDGQATLNPERGGIYRLMVRRSADAPAGSKTSIRSYTTSLVVEIAPAP